MIPRVARISIAILLVLLLVTPPPPAFACGPDFTLPTYTAFDAPEDTDSAYEHGRLGLLQRGYRHIYLYEAYRNLSGKPFSDAERKALQIWWRGGTQPQVPGQIAANNKPQDWVAAWLEIRARTLGKSEKNKPSFHDERGILRTESRDNRFLFYYNCLQDAFQNAVYTANKREKQFGAESPAFKEWVTAQDQVFENCAGNSGYPPKPKPAVIPAVAHDNDPASIRADRADQIAAAHFYAGEFDSAQTAFQEIAKDSSSPYRTIAPYLVARVLIRKATLGSKEEGIDTESMEQAEK